jgi:perosamine synthetase
MIPIYKPFLDKYKTSAKDAIESEWISNHGMYVDLATNLLCEKLGVKHCVLMNNGTSATHCLYKALKFKYPSLTKIYIPNNVFIAPYSTGLQEYPPENFEVMRTNPNTMNICTDEEYIRTLEKGAAVMIVHNLGNIINVPRLQRLRPDLIFIEDNCEGLFGKYEGQFSGTSPFTLCSSVSFYGNKTITTGEGGAFFTNDLEIYKYIKTYFSHGMSERRYVHSLVGTNYRMTNVQAAFLYDQLNDLESILKEKERIYKTYEKELGKEFSLFEQEDRSEHSKWMFSLRVKGIEYEKLEKALLEKNIQIRPVFYDIHDHDSMKQILNKENKIDFLHECFMLPSYPSLTEIQQKYIVHCVKEYYSFHKNKYRLEEKVTVEMINEFLANRKSISRHFRYYDKRRVEDVLKNHLYTLVCYEEDKVIGYGHIDFEGKAWLGICILNEYQGKGYGRILMKKLLEYVDSKKMDVYLTVDSDNILAIELYLKNGFQISKKEGSVVWMYRIKQ